MLVYREALRRGANGPTVVELQTALNDCGAQLETDGDYGPVTTKAVQWFQYSQNILVDGVAGRETYKTLNLVLGAGAKPLTAEEPPAEVLLPGSRMNYGWAAKQLLCEEAAIRAVAKVESAGSGFFAPSKPKILFERHWMYRQLKAHGLDADQFARSHADVVNRNAGGYKGGIREYDRLQRAMEIHAESALESASWGAFQIMGFHWKLLKYPSVQAYVERMESGEQAHLEAFVRFIQANNQLLRAIRAKDFHRFALGYNGPKQRGYDAKMRAAYNANT